MYTLSVTVTYVIIRPVHWSENLDHGCRLRPLIFMTNNDVLDGIHPNRELRNCSCAILRTMNVVEVHCLCNNKLLYLAKRLPNSHSQRSKGTLV